MRRKKMDVKEAYIKHFGSDEGWLGQQGSWFTEGFQCRCDAVAVWNPLWKRWEIPDPKNAALSIPIPSALDLKDDPNDDEYPPF
jgi:hypothetical protein